MHARCHPPGERALPTPVVFCSRHRERLPTCPHQCRAPGLPPPHRARSPNSVRVPTFCAASTAPAGNDAATHRCLAISRSPARMMPGGLALPRGRNKIGSACDTMGRATRQRRSTCSLGEPQRPIRPGYVTPRCPGRTLGVQRCLTRDRASTQMAAPTAMMMRARANTEKRHAPGVLKDSWWQTMRAASTPRLKVAMRTNP